MQFGLGESKASTQSVEIDRTASQIRDDELSPDRFPWHESIRRLGAIKSRFPGLGDTVRTRAQDVLRSESGFAMRILSGCG